MDNTQKGVEEVQQELAEQGKQLAEKDATTGDRLDKWFATQERQLPEQPQSAEGKQPEPTPSSEEPKAEKAQEEEKSPVQTSVVTEEEALDNSKNPERTREYIERLQAENKRLKEEKRKAYGQSVFDDLRGGQEPTPAQNQYPSNVPQYVPPIQLPHPSAQQYVGLNQPQIDNIVQQFVDPQGNVDINGLNNALRTANQRAIIAEQQAISASRMAQTANQNIIRYEEDQQVREAHAAVPDIDPLSKDFDPELFELVKDRIFRNMQTGKQERLVDIARSLKKLRAREERVETKEVQKAQDEAVEKYKEAQKQRNQGPIEMGKGQDRQSIALDDLKQRTRKGGLENSALDTRLRAAGIIS